MPPCPPDGILAAGGPDAAVAALRTPQAPLSFRLLGEGARGLRLRSRAGPEAYPESDEVVAEPPSRGGVARPGTKRVEVSGAAAAASATGAAAAAAPPRALLLRDAALLAAASAARPDRPFLQGAATATAPGARLLRGTAAVDALDTLDALDALEPGPGQPFLQGLTATVTAPGDVDALEPGPRQPLNMQEGTAAAARRQLLGQGAELAAAAGESAGAPGEPRVQGAELAAAAAAAAPKDLLLPGGGGLAAAAAAAAEAPRKLLRSAGREQGAAAAAGAVPGRRLLQESGGTVSSPPPEVSPTDAASPPPCSNDIPSTAAVVGGVVGGLAGLTLILAGALLAASGAINRWRWWTLCWPCCGGRWRPLSPGDKDGGGGKLAAGGSERGALWRGHVSNATTLGNQPSTRTLLNHSNGGGDGGNGGGAAMSPKSGGWGLFPGGRDGGGSSRRSGSGDAAEAGEGGAEAAAAALAAVFGVPDVAGLGGAGDGGASSQLGETLSPTSQHSVSLLGPLAVDTAWRDCLIEPAKIQILRRPSGQPWRLGGGAFGQVYKALYDDVQVVAVKVLNGMSDPKQLEAFLREGRILRDCRDRNIVQFVGAAFDPSCDQAMLVTEFMEAGDLWRALKWRDEQGRRVFGWYRRQVYRSGKKWGRKVALDSARGLHYLHSRHVWHMDLKSANILLAPDGTAKLADMGLSAVLTHCTDLVTNILLARDGTAKLADVGLAKVVTKDYLSAVNTMGTFCWAAPEILTGQAVDAKADIYSFGVVLWEICTGETPSRGQLRTIEVPGECPPEVHDLCERCMASDPRDRPSAKDIVLALEHAVGDVSRAATLAGRLSNNTEAPPSSNGAGGGGGTAGGDGLSTGVGRLTTTMEEAPAPAPPSPSASPFAAGALQQRRDSPTTPRGAAEGAGALGAGHEAHQEATVRGGTAAAALEGALSPPRSSDTYSGYGPPPSLAHLPAVVTSGGRRPASSSGVSSAAAAAAAPTRGAGAGGAAGGLASASGSADVAPAGQLQQHELELVPPVSGMVGAISGECPAAAAAARRGGAAGPADGRSVPAALPAEGSSHVPLEPWSGFGAPPQQQQQQQPSSLSPRQQSSVSLQHPSVDLRQPSVFLQQSSVVLRQASTASRFSTGPLTPNSNRPASPFELRAQAATQRPSGSVGGTARGTTGTAFGTAGSSASPGRISSPFEALALRALGSGALASTSSELSRVGSTVPGTAHGTAAVPPSSTSGHTKRVSFEAIPSFPPSREGSSLKEGLSSISEGMPAYCAPGTGSLANGKPAAAKVDRRSVVEVPPEVEGA
ncbi:hypothetical protein N2152v2_000293 [Parachlorella kessleri]